MAGTTPPSGSVRLVRDALDPVLVAAGFAAGQGGDDEAAGGQVIFCMAHDELSRRHPQLPQAHQQQDDGTCVDLVVDVGDDGVFTGLDLETASLVATLRHVGIGPEADAVAQVFGRPVVDGLPAVVTALRRLFGVVG